MFSIRKLIEYLVSYDTQKEHAIKLSQLPTRPALYEDKEVLAAQPWFSRLRPVFENAVARPSTVTGANYNKVSTIFFQITNQILNGQYLLTKGFKGWNRRSSEPCASGGPADKWESTLSTTEITLDEETLKKLDEIRGLVAAILPESLPAVAEGVRDLPLPFLHLARPLPPW